MMLTALVPIVFLKQDHHVIILYQNGITNKKLEIMLGSPIKEPMKSYPDVECNLCHRKGHYFSKCPDFPNADHGGRGGRGRGCGRGAGSGSIYLWVLEKEDTQSSVPVNSSRALMFAANGAPMIISGDRNHQVLFLPELWINLFSHK